ARLRSAEHWRPIYRPSPWRFPSRLTILAMRRRRPRTEAPHLVSRASYSVRGIAVTEKSYTALTRVGLLLKPALLLEVGFRRRMHRGGVTLVRHVLRVEVRQCRMQALEGVEVLEHGVDEGTNDLIRHVRRGNNRRAHA